ncbi:MAG TPA: N-acetylmuramoyl-L-alanine amidase [Terriglobales bacterium]|nr:N-acetylmuramoyl-L-alanine amidase [Terriglobales bacterium]
MISAFAIPACASARQAQAAQSQFSRAEKLRGNLNERHDPKRADYQRVINAYRRVYYLDPASPKAAPSVLAVAELLADMGRQLHSANDLRSAIGQYKFLFREYPGYRYRADALLVIARIYSDDLHDSASARAAYRDFLKRYPHSRRADEARQSLAALASAPYRSRHATEAKKEVPAKPEVPATTSDAGLSRVTRIRYWSKPDSSRVAVDVDSDITFRSERLSHPDRIVFDLHWTRLSPSLAGKIFAPKTGLLKQIHVSESKPGNARLILRVQDPATYSAFLLPNPNRLIIDIHAGNSAEARTGPNLRDAKNNAGQPETGRTDTGVAATRGNAPGVKIITDEEDNVSPPRSAASAASALPPSIKRPAHVVVREDGENVEAREARPTASGDRSLIRALGLKIGKIVIDPGHGGHDTGTIGPHGLEEKNLVLDVGLRLGKLLQQRLGADVVYTRDDDTFVPLETRTAIANQARADLFISVHANSSHNAEARGVETYYLNFTTSRDALEVAARENAVSDQSIYQLQQLVRTITLQEKIEESREFAADVQHALYSGLAAQNPGLQNRGVKKAPFVVLIGAKMPSILAEISFVSNPRDERKLRSPAYRERIALALYRGVAQYVSGLSGIKVASSAAQSDGQ